MKGILEYEFPGIIIIKDIVNIPKAFEVTSSNNDILWSRASTYNYPNHDTVIKKLVDIGYERRPKNVKKPLRDGYY